jgi:hypothetical protein
MAMAWNPDGWAARMRKSMTYVSAFFLIDSVHAVEHCHQAFASLMNRDIAQHEDCEYFQRVRNIYITSKEVVNFDHEFYFGWNGQKHRILLRVHSVEPGKYEAELQMPGLIAATMEEQFGTGEDGKFFCAFMPHSWYD